MQQAIPYSSGRVTWLGPAASASVSVSVSSSSLSSSSVSTAAAAAAAGEKGGAAAAGAVAWRRTVEESAAAVVGRRGCCMSHVVRRLLQGLGVNPTVCDVDDGGAADAAALAEEFAKIGAGEVSLPAVFIGGKLVGGLDRLMALHISGDLVPILKQAGALWL